MAELKERVSKEIITAMKAKDKIRLNVLRFLKKLFIENDTSKKPISEMDIVISHAKKTKDSLEHYPEGDQRNIILQELEILGEFLPKALTRDEVIAMILAIKEKSDNPNMGVIMKELSPSIKGKFDGKEASALIKEYLN